MWAQIPSAELEKGRLSGPVTDASKRTADHILNGGTTALPLPLGRAVVNVHAIRVQLTSDFWNATVRNPAFQPSSLEPVDPTDS